MIGVHRRAAFDIGSGATKVVVAGVRPLPKATSFVGYKVEEVFYEKETEILLAESMHKGDGKNISDSSLAHCFQTLQHYVAQAEKFGVPKSQLFGIGTQVGSPFPPHHHTTKRTKVFKIDIVVPFRSSERQRTAQSSSARSRRS